MSDYSGWKNRVTHDVAMHIFNTYNVNACGYPSCAGRVRQEIGLMIDLELTKAPPLVRDFISASLAEVDWEAVAAAVNEAHERA